MIGTVLCQIFGGVGRQSAYTTCFACFTDPLCAFCMETLQYLEGKNEL